MAAKEKEEARNLVFFRITVLGSTGSGKTSLVNSFVNACCPQRYARTEAAVVYHKKIEVVDDSEWEDVWKPILLEIEDTPGSERGPDGEDGGGAEEDHAGGAPEVKRGSRVTLLPLAEKNQVLAAFNDPKYKGRLQYKPAMDGMLGREFAVKAMGKDGSVGLPSPDGSEGGIWNFPLKAVKLKVAMDLPVDQFLNLGEKEAAVIKKLADRKKYINDLQFPLTAYNRPIGDQSMDRTLTKNRMGYMLCFDMSDDTGESLKEAMYVYGMLRKSLAKRASSKLHPIIWLIGCKSDRTGNHNAFMMNKDSALAWSYQEEIMFYDTSAKNHRNVNLVFGELAKAIAAKESLWKFEVEGEGEEEDNQGTCYSQ